MKKILMLLCLLIVLTGCSKSEIKTVEVEAEPKVDYSTIEEPFVASYAQKIDDLRPYRYLHSEGKAILRNLHEGIYKVDEMGNLKSEIANQITVSEEDGYLVYRIVLRDGVKFHNGNALTPEDIQYSIFRLTGLIPDMDLDNMENSKYWRNMVNGLASEGFKKGRVEISGSSEIVLYLDDFYGEEVTSSILADTFIVPMGYSEEEQSEFPIGLGPYQFVERDRVGTMHFTRFPEYYGKKPEIKNLTFINLDAKQDRIDAFVEGYIHMIDSYPALNKEGDYKNLSNDIYSLVFNIENETYSNIELREAIYSGVNKENIHKEVFAETGEVVESPLNSLRSLYLEGVDLTKSHNPDRSREILAANPEFSEIELNIAYMEEDFLSQSIGEFIVQDLGYLGLTANLIPIPIEEFNEFVLLNKDYEMAIVRFTGTLDPYRTMDRFTTRTRRNVSGFYQLDYNKFLTEDRDNYKGMIDMIKKDYTELFLVDPGNSFKLVEGFTEPTYYPYPYLDFSSIKYVR